MRKKTFICRMALIFAMVVGFGVTAFVHATDDLDDLESYFANDDDAPAASAPSGGGAASDGFDIDALFGVFKAEPEKPAEPEAPKRVLPPFTGNYKVLVGRPIYAVYEAERNTQWISALGELFTQYKVASFPRTHVYPMEQVNNVLPNFRDYSRRFSRQHFIEAARRLGATHLLYQEYQPLRGGRTTRYSMELFWLEENATVEKFAVDIDHNRFEEGLHQVLTKIAEAMDEGAVKTPAFNSTVWGRDQKVLEAFGGVLANEGSFSKDNATAAYAAAERAIQRNGGANVGFHYAGALLAGRAERYAQAIHHMEIVIAKSREYPALQLRLAEYLRGAERYSEAMRAAEVAAQNPALRVPAAIEMAAIHQRQGNLTRAKSEYEAIVSSGDADGLVFFRLALLSIQAGNVSESEEYLRRAGASGFGLDEDQYFELGQAYAKAGRGFEERAIDLLKRSMGIRQNREEAWEVIAEVYGNMGNEPLQAEAYVNMFKINMQGNSARLKAAGEIYEKIGLTDKARDAYALFLDRRFTDDDVSLSLARIYFNEKNCNRLRDVLKGFEANEEARQMLEGCGIRVRILDTTQTIQKEKLPPIVVAMRYGGLGLAAGGLAGALVLDLAVLPGQVEKYGGYPGNPNDYDVSSDAVNYNKVKDLRKSIDTNVMLRNLLYIAGGVGISAFTVTYFF